MGRDVKQLPKPTEALSLAAIEDLRKKGYNQSQIAEMYGVSRQAVSWHKKTYGGFLTTRQIVNKAWPWKTNNAHGKCKPYQRLRDHGEFMARGADGVHGEKMARLIAWWAKLREENVVLEFDPSFPPEPGVSPAGGFRYVPRLDSDGDLLIRVNEHTDLSEEGRMIWRWPPSDWFDRYLKKQQE